MIHILFMSHSFHMVLHHKYFSISYNKYQTSFLMAVHNSVIWMHLFYHFPLLFRLSHILNITHKSKIICFPQEE